MPTMILHILRFLGVVLFLWSLLTLYFIYVNRNFYFEDASVGLIELLKTITLTGLGFWLFKFCGRKLSVRTGEPTQGILFYIGGFLFTSFHTAKFLVALLIGGLTLFAIVMFIAAPILTDDQGRFPWQSYTPPNVEANIYEDCSREASTFSTFININTNDQKLEYCLNRVFVQYVTDLEYEYGQGYYEYIENSAIPDDFKVLILTEIRLRSIVAQSEAQSPKANAIANPSKLSASQAQYSVNEWIRTNKYGEAETGPARAMFRDDVRRYHELMFRLPLCGASPISTISWNGEVWEFGEKFRLGSGTFNETTKEVSLKLHHACVKKS